MKISFSKTKKPSVLSKIKVFFENLLFPQNIKCLSCQRDLPKKQEIEFCEECKKKFVFIGDNCCTKCGTLLKHRNLCLNCKSHPRDFELARSVFSYDGEIKRLIVNFKYGNKPYFSKTFGCLMAKKFCEMKIDVDGVIFVPATAKRVKQRGYNQAELLCNEFSKVTKIPIFGGALVKSKDTQHQAGLGFKQRQENIKKSFSVVNKDILKGKSILLIDDVFTTGATTNACSERLKTAGAKAVYVLTLASTPQKIVTQKTKIPKKDK